MFHARESDPTVVRADRAARDASHRPAVTVPEPVTESLAGSVRDRPPATARPWSAPAVLGLQRRAGNAAVARLVGRADIPAGRQRPEPPASDREPTPDARVEPPSPVAEPVAPRPAAPPAPPPAPSPNASTPPPRPVVDRRPPPSPVMRAAPPGSASTLAKGPTSPPEPSAAPAPAETSAPPAAASAPLTLDAGGASDDGGGEAPAPAPGLGDGELASLDADVDAGPAGGTGAAAGSADPGAEAEPDPGAAQSEIAAGAQAEVTEASAETGSEPDPGGGGGGGGGAIEAPPEPPAPDVSAAPPDQAMATLSNLRPTQMAATLGGVQAAAAGAVSREQARLAAEQPKHTPLAGATAAGPVSDRVPAGAAPSTAQVPRVAPGQPPPAPVAPTLPAPGPAPAAQVAAPALPAAPEGGLTQDAARDLASTISRLPTRDPGTQATPGPVPTVNLTGEADPGQVAAQQAHLQQGTAHAQAEGTRDAAEPLGEDAVRPSVPVETIEADVPGAGPGGTPPPAPAAAGSAAAAGGGEGGEDAAINAVAEEQQGPAMRAAAASAAGAIAGARQEHATAERTQRQSAAQEVAALEAEHAQAEATERAGVRTEAATQRAQWRGEQQAMVAGAQAEAQAVGGQAGQAIAAERTQAQTEAAAAHAQGEQEAGQARQEGEREAARHRAEAQQESGGGGFFGWVASKASALFDKVKQGISAAFERARQAVRSAIEKAQKLATAVIERAQQAIVGAIRLAGAALTAIGDRLLAGFPALRDKFRNAIQAAVRRAETAVNRLAEGLKAGVKAALGLLGRGLTALLSGLEAGLKAAVDGVASAVKGAISAARAALEALGAFMAIAKDVAADPGGWLRNLGAAVMDGIRNHLWQALKTAVSQWFNDKVEQVLGLGRAVWNLLTKGGISLVQIGKMAWEGIKQAIPAALIGLLVEKLASMIIPAAGAVLAIIQGLQAAWGAVSRVLQAIDRFITFLKAVKGGNGGPAFANALAAAGIAVVDFVSNWLLARLAKGASKVAGKIREIAQRIGKSLKKVVGKIGKALRGIGKKIGDRLRKLRDKYKAWREKRKAKKGKKDKDKKSEDKEQKLKKRLEKAITAIRPQAERLLSEGVGSLALRARLLYWKIRYRLTTLELRGSGQNAEIWATVNPGDRVTGAVTETPAQLRTVVNQAVRDVLRDGTVRQRLRSTRAQVRSDPSKLDASGGEGWGAATQHLRNEGSGRAWPRQQQVGAHGSDIGPGLTAQENRPPPWMRGPANAFVKDVGTYPQIARDLKATGIPDAQMAQHMQELIRTGVAPRSLNAQQAKLLGSVAWLMFGRESHRNRRNYAYAPMTVDLIQSGHMSWDDAFSRYESGPESRTGKRGMFPMSMKGAEGAARELNPQDTRIARPDAKPPSEAALAARRANRDELERRETELVTAWVTARLGVQGGLVGLSRQALGDHIRRMVREFYSRY